MGKKREGQADCPVCEGDQVVVTCATGGETYQGVVKSAEVNGDTGQIDVWASVTPQAQAAPPAPPEPHGKPEDKDPMAAARLQSQQLKEARERREREEAQSKGGQGGRK